jgi:hypothetical protein
MHLHHAPDAEPQQNPLLHPGIYLPAGGRSVIGLRRAHPTFIQRQLEFVEGAEVFVAVLVGLAGVQFLNGGLKIYQILLSLNSLA